MKKDMQIQKLVKKLKEGRTVELVRRDIAKALHLGKLPKNLEILNMLNSESRETYKEYLITKPMRTISGVAPLAIMSAPYACPHGRCIFCPGGPGSEFGDVPQSYTGKEPSTMRAIRAGYDAYKIVFNRLEQYVVTGRIPEKCDVIIQGGTFLADPPEYQEQFITEIYRAMNDFSDIFFSNGRLNFEKFKKFFELPGEIGDMQRLKKIHGKIDALKKKSTLEREKKKNETAIMKCIGMTIETKPDWGFLEHGNAMLKFGCTRVELGIQSVYEDVIKKLNRGHTVQDSIDSTRILKDLGFKINYHYMLGLPGSTPEKDLQGLHELFDNPDFRPDMLKIYPCLVMKGTPLYRMWQQGKFNPITVESSVKIISEFKKFVPKYVRIMRVQRDIPEYVITAGPKKTNLRQAVEDSCRTKNIHCQCIRCREIKRYEGKAKITMHVQEYAASQGTEFFISLDTDNDELVGYCRMRFPAQSLRKEIGNDAALLRELHIYSDALRIGETSEKSFQHRGFGRKLMERAEALARGHGKKKMVVISGIGARNYYRRLDYKLNGPYMSKLL